MTDDLSARLLVAIAEAAEAANRMRHADPDEGGYYACPATRSEPYGDLGYGEAACDCGMPQRRAEALRFCQAHREIVEHVHASIEGWREDEADPDDTAAAITDLRHVLTLLAGAYSLSECP